MRVDNPSTPEFQQAFNEWLRARTANQEAVALLAAAQLEGHAGTVRLEPILDLALVARMHVELALEQVELAANGGRP